MRKRRFTRSLFMLLVAGLLLVLTGSLQASTDDEINILRLDLQGLEDLGPDFVYEGWIIVDGAPVSTGIFSIDAAGDLSQYRFVVEENRRNIDAFVLTIEPYPDPDPAPSDTHVLAGDVRTKLTQLTVDHPAALGSDFAAADGTFILAVPSDTNGVANYTNGIWWLDPAAGPGPGLNLPTLPAGWVYEGWVVGENGPISTGTFTDVAAADSDAGGPEAGPGATPPFPGQDFVTPPTDLTGYTAVISIEPYPDNSPAPFAFKPVVGEIVDPGAPGIALYAGNNAESLASGTLRIDRGFRYEVTLENLAATQPVSPPVAITHFFNPRLFAPGFMASPGLEAVAENGDPSLLVEELTGDRNVTEVVNVGVPLTPHGQTVGSFTDSVTFEIVGLGGDRLSIVGMLICTNDGLVGGNRLTLPRHGGTRTFNLRAYDAGTELNTELSTDIVDPCSVLGPVVLNGDNNGNNNDGIEENRPVKPHRGIVGDADLLPAHNWDNPVATLTITRID